MQLSLLDDGLSIHVFTGKQSKLFWFIIVKTTKYGCAEKQWYASDTARRICEGLHSKKLHDNLTFEDVWSRCTIFKMTPLEEGVFRLWHRARLVCIGDAIRKVCIYFLLVRLFLVSGNKAPLPHSLNASSALTSSRWLPT